MEERKVQPKKLTPANTKQEMLQALNEVLKQLETQKDLELKPEKRLEEKKAKEVLAVAETLSSERVTKGIRALKIEVGAERSERCLSSANR